jgi:hypothetical protein
MSKQARPNSPAGTRLRGPDGDGNYEVIIPSASAPGTEHTLDVTCTGAALGCSCPGYRRYLDYLASLRTATPLPARRPCWHVEGAADLLAHHLDPPPADPGGAALDRAQRDVDAETRAWTAAPVRPLDRLLADRHGAWLVTRSERRTVLTCAACFETSRFPDDAAAVAFLERGAVCRCGGGGPIPPAQGAARKPLDDCLQDLYGG